MYKDMADVFLIHVKKGADFMKIKFKMSINHYEHMMKALKYTAKIYKGQWSCLLDLMNESEMLDKNSSRKNLEKQMECLKEYLIQKENLNELSDIIEENCVKAASGLDNLIDEFNTLFKITKGKKMKFEMNMSDWDISLFKTAIDKIPRFQLGQWNELVNMLYPACGSLFFASQEQENCIVLFRNRICPIFAEKCIGANASFGIYSRHVNDSARVLYDLYKVFMYEDGVGGVYGYAPKQTSEDIMLPEVEFEPIGEMIYSGNDNEVFKFMEGKEDRVRYYDDKPELYVCEKEDTWMTFTPVHNGDRLLRLRNGNCKVIKKKCRK